MHEPLKVLLWAKCTLSWFSSTLTSTDSRGACKVSCIWTKFDKDLNKQAESLLQLVKASSEEKSGVKAKEAVESCTCCAHSTSRLGLEAGIVNRMEFQQRDSLGLSNVIYWTYGKRCPLLPTSAALFLAIPETVLSQNTPHHWPVTKPEKSTLLTLVWNSEGPAKMWTCSAKRNTRLYQDSLVQVAGFPQGRIVHSWGSCLAKWGVHLAYILQRWIST